MKKIGVFLVALFVLGATLAVAQPVPGKKFEFGTSVSFTSIKISGGFGADSYLIMPVRFGYYIWKGLEIEPELLITSVHPGGHTGFNLSGNVAYHFSVAGRLVPFVLAGVGTGNGYATGPVVSSSTDTTAFLINGGAGAKYLLGNIAAVRMEYRYTRNRLNKGGFLFQNTDIHQVFIGLSIFF
jgi:hypothetical protein